MATQDKPYILFAHPDDAFSKDAVTALENEGLENVIRVHNGVEALVAFVRMPPQLVILAENMPEKDGFSTCQTIQSLPFGDQMSVLLLLDDQNYKDINRAYRSGATGFMCQPMETRMLAKHAHFMLRDRKKAKDLQRSERRVNHAYRIANLGDWEWDIFSANFIVSLEVARMFRSSRKALRSMDDIISHINEDYRIKFSESIIRVMEDGIPRSLEFCVTLPNGAERTFVQWVEAERDNFGQYAKLVGLVQDVTEQRAAENKIYNLSHYDSLTGLPNRGYLKQHLAFLLDQAKITHSNVAVLLIDIDKFGRINSALGHSMGDELLCAVAHTLKDAIEDNTLLAGETGDVKHNESEQMLLLRTDADEFALVINQLSRPEKAGVVAERISQLFAEPLNIESQRLNITVSIGISLYPLDTDNDSNLLESASMALNHAKKQGRNNYQYFMQSFNQLALKRLGLENDMRQALAKKEFIVFYQPKVNLKTGKVDAMEALVRWQHSVLGMVSPQEFVALAEDIGLIIELSDWILQEACRQTKEWINKGYDLKVAVNLSPKQFEDHVHLIDVVTNVLADTRLPSSNLELELTESVFLNDTDVNKSTVDAIKDMGVSVAIDDFGTGYSSLSYLTKFKVDTLKIDKSFISCVTGDEQQAGVVTTIIEMANRMKMNVVAEGVASDAEVEFVKKHDCDAAQGYFFSPPLPATRFIEWVDEFNSKVDG